MVSPSTSGRPGLCGGAHLCCRLLIRKPPPGLQRLGWCSCCRGAEQTKRGSRFIWKGTETNVKHTCRSAKAALSHTSHPLRSEFERSLQMSVGRKRISEGAFILPTHLFTLPSIPPHALNDYGCCGAHCVCPSDRSL